MCGIFFGRSKRFRAEDHLPVPLASSAIQTFLCGGSKLPLGSVTFSKSTVGAGPVWKDACMDWARVYLRNAPVHALGPELDQAEA